MFTTVARKFGLKIRGQLLLAMFVAAMLAALVAVAMETITHTRALRQWATTEAQSVADAMSNDFLKLILIGDPDSAANLAKQLTSFPLIHSLVVHNPDGEALFQFRRDSDPKLTPDPDNATERFSITREISDQGTRYGWVELTISGAKLRANISDYYNYLVVVVLGLLLISAASALYFQRFFSGPVLHLTKFMHRVTIERDFSLRIGNRRSDEFGVLNGGVNKLLAEMQNAQRNLQLRNEELGAALHRLQLESRAKENALNAMLQATTANREKSTFLTTMSHELRTPLNAIIGYSELLDEDAVAAGNTSASNDLRKIRSAGRHLLSLINDVLDLSKIEAGKLQLEFTSFDARDLVNETLALVEPLLERGHNRLQINNVSSAPMHSDPFRIRQVLFNLLSNACKFTHNGTITVTVTLGDGVDTGRIHFSVRDTGEGLTNEDLLILFQPFVQAESVGHKREGTGLGLALSRHFCNMLGGEIHARSIRGQGSEFYFWLPLHAPTGELHGR